MLSFGHWQDAIDQATNLESVPSTLSRPLKGLADESMILRVYIKGAHYFKYSISIS